MWPVIAAKMGEWSAERTNHFPVYGINKLCVVINVLKSVKSDGAAFLME